MIGKIKQMLSGARLKIFKNRLVKGKVGNFEIFLNYGHSLPRIMKKHPEYSMNFLRLAEKMLQKYPQMKAVDVGANVGDSLALLKTAGVRETACIEGDASYFEILKKNSVQFSEVSIFQEFLSDRLEEKNVKVEKRDGTLKIIGGGTSAVKTETLDGFIAAHSKFKSAKLLKIDADGFDLKIIRGGFGFIKSAKPALFFEYARCEFEPLGGNGLETLENLRSAGYGKILFYDNYGRFMLSSDLSDKKTVAEMHHYANGKISAFPYFDVTVFHQEDEEIAGALAESEIGGRM